jgi:2-oxoisovalerate dehydrogenase E1 component alpha subunit
MKEMAQELRSTESGSARDKALPLERGLLARMYELMVEARVLEERLIQMYRQGHGYFWIGGPGEEAFNVPLGLLINKGQGLDYDYLHFHYRQLATLLAMGEEPINPLRQMKSTATDPYSGGRNFIGHFSIKKWNVVPVSSPIEVQYAMAPGTARAQKRHGGDGITIVTGGDAGTAESDFASCLLWSARPGDELPILIIVTNNQWGISTSHCSQHGCKAISDRGKAFNIRSKTIDGNDPIASYLELREAMNYVRKERKPFLLEALVSRLYGHSSASGANFVPEEVDCIPRFEKVLEQNGILTHSQMTKLRAEWATKIADLARKVIEEPQPSRDAIWHAIFAEKR